MATAELTLNELAEELQRQADAKVDYVSDTRRMSFAVEEDRPGPGAPLAHLSAVEQKATPKVRLQLDGGASDDDGVSSFDVTDHAHGQIASRLKIPKPYYDRLRTEAPNLLVDNVNHWFTRKPERRLLRTMDGRARAFLSDRYRRRDNIDLAEAILPVLGSLPNVEFHSTAITDSRLYLKALLPGIEGEIKKGDVVRAGVIVENSEIGAGALSVSPFLLRLICTNGMTVPEWGNRYRHTGARIDLGDDEEKGYSVFSDRTLSLDDAAFFAKVGDLVRAACSQVQFDAITDQLRVTTETQVGFDHVGNVERLAKKHNLTEKEGGSVLSHLIEGGDLSAWGYVNGVTALARQTEDYDRRSELEKLGGKLAYQPATEWAAIGRAS